MDDVRKLAALAGMVGSILFAGCLVGLSILDYDFLRGLGWDPVHAPTFDWPSGLALGPHGQVMQAVFVAEGVLMAVFAAGLASLGGRSAMVLFGLAGIGMAGLAFPADPTIRETPATLAGNLHDGSFVFLGLMLLPALLLCGRAFFGQAEWRGLAAFTWITAALMIPAFALKGWLFYAFMAAFLGWSVAVGVRLWKT